MKHLGLRGPQSTGANLLPYYKPHHIQFRTAGGATSQNEATSWGAGLGLSEATALRLRCISAAVLIEDRAAVRWRFLTCWLFDHWVEAKDLLTWLNVQLVTTECHRDRHLGHWPFHLLIGTRCELFSLFTAYGTHSGCLSTAPGTELSVLQSIVKINDTWRNYTGTE